MSPRRRAREMRSTSMRSRDVVEPAVRSRIAPDLVIVAAGFDAHRSGSAGGDTA